MTDTRLLADLLFAQPGLDRAAHLRKDPQFMEDLLNERTRVMWVNQGESPIDPDCDTYALVIIFPWLCLLGYVIFIEIIFIVFDIIFIEFEARCWGPRTVSVLIELLIFVVNLG